MLYGRGWNKTVSGLYELDSAILRLLALSQISLLGVVVSSFIITKPRQDVALFFPRSHIYAFHLFCPHNVQAVCFADVPDD